MAALSHRKSASTGTSCDSCCLQLLALFMTVDLLRETIKVTLRDISFITALSFSKSMDCSEFLLPGGSYVLFVVYWSPHKKQLFHVYIHCCICL